MTGGLPGFEGGLRMTMYWIYDLPNWTLGLLIVAIFVAVSLAGLFAMRPVVAMSGPRRRITMTSSATSSRESAYSTAWRWD